MSIITPWATRDKKAELTHSQCLCGSQPLSTSPKVLMSASRWLIKPLSLPFWGTPQEQGLEAVHRPISQHVPSYSLTTVNISIQDTALLAASHQQPPLHTPEAQRPPEQAKAFLTYCQNQDSPPALGSLSQSPQEECQVGHSSSSPGIFFHYLPSIDRTCSA